MANKLNLPSVSGSQLVVGKVYYLDHELIEYGKLLSIDLEDDEAIFEPLHIIYYTIGNGVVPFFANSDFYLKED